MVATPTRVDLGHTARIRTVISSNVVLVVARSQAIPDVGNSFIGQGKAFTATRPLRDVCHSFIPFWQTTGLDETIPVWKT